MAEGLEDCTHELWNKNIARDEERLWVRSMIVTSDHSGSGDVAETPFYLCIDQEDLQFYTKQLRMCDKSFKSYHYVHVCPESL